MRIFSFLSTFRGKQVLQMSLSTCSGTKQLQSPSLLLFPGLCGEELFATVLAVIIFHVLRDAIATISVSSSSSSQKPVTKLMMFAALRCTVSHEPGRYVQNKSGALMWPSQTFKFCWGNGAWIHLHQELNTFMYPVILTWNWVNSRSRIKQPLVRDGTFLTNHSGICSIFLWILLSWTMATFCRLQYNYDIGIYAQIKQCCVDSLWYVHYNTNSRRVAILSLEHWLS